METHRRINKRALAVGAAGLTLAAGIEIGGMQRAHASENDPTVTHIFDGTITERRGHVTKFEKINPNYTITRAGDNKTLMVVGEQSNWGTKEGEWASTSKESANLALGDIAANGMDIKKVTDQDSSSDRKILRVTVDNANKLDRSKSEIGDKGIFQEKGDLVKIERPREGYRIAAVNDHEVMVVGEQYSWATKEAEANYSAEETAQHGLAELGKIGLDVVKTKPLKDVPGNGDEHILKVTVKDAGLLNNAVE